LSGAVEGIGRAAEEVLDEVEGLLGRVAGGCRGEGEGLCAGEDGEAAGKHREQAGWKAEICCQGIRTLRRIRRVRDIKDAATPLHAESLGGGAHRFLSSHQAMKM
jgi:hypothetical protein